MRAETFYESLEVSSITFCGEKSTDFDGKFLQKVLGGGGGGKPQRSTSTTSEVDHEREGRVSAKDSSPRETAGGNETMSPISRGKKVITRTPVKGGRQKRLAILKRWERGGDEIKKNEADGWVSKAVEGEPWGAHRKGGKEKEYIA